MKKDATIRSTQLVGTFGVGALVPVDDESVMIAGLDYWRIDRADIFEPRLAKRLAVYGFASPPASGKGGQDIPVARFPRLYVCSGDCRRLDVFEALSDRGRNRCTACQELIFPSRFVVVCSRGHIDDFPYHTWIHRQKVEDPRRHRLTLGSLGTSASLRDVVAACSCGAQRSMDGAFLRSAFDGFLTCSGGRPWLGDREQCNAVPRTLQRGASNVYFPVTASAIVIPPWSEPLGVFVEEEWSRFEFIDDPVAIEAVARRLCEDESVPYDPKDVVEMVLRRKAGTEASSGEQGNTLRYEEYRALEAGRPEVDADQEFVAVSGEGAGEVSRYFKSVMAVERLREVRALISFTRLKPPIDVPRRLHAPLWQKPPKNRWLPAVQIAGEGLFFTLDEAAVAVWEQRDDVLRRLGKVSAGRAEKRVWSGSDDCPGVIHPRVVLIHTLAHAIINQWSIDCGYPTSSLRERLYVSTDDMAEPMCGFLIYTASADSAGSLGGVVARAGVGLLRETVEGAIQRVSWCSSEPLCIESEPTGTDGLNLAACHACVLLPEVSCELQNVLLDRGLVIGTPEDPSMGFYSDRVRH